MNINDLMAAFETAGQKVQDLQSKQSEMSVKLTADPDAYSDEEIEKFNSDLSKAQKVRDFAKSTLDEARKSMKTSKIGVSDSEHKISKMTADKVTEDFVSDVKDMVSTGKVAGDDSNAGLTIPDDVQTSIHTLVRSFDSLANLVNIENVTVPKGSRVYEKLSDVTPFVNLDDEDAEIPSIDNPVLTTIKYEIKQYAGIITATNTLLKDTAENVLNWLTNWAAKKDVVTRNLQILDKLNSDSAAKVAIAKFDDIKDLDNNTLDPAIIASSSFITNQSGFNVLSKVKDNDGQYLMKPSVTQPDIYQIDGKDIMVLADKWLPDTKDGHPLYFGDLKQAVTLYDREEMSVISTNIGAGAFERNQTKIRFIDRFDVELIDDGAYAVGTFTDIADQDAAKASATKSSK